MESRVVLAYALLALMTFAGAALMAVSMRKRRRRRRIMRGWRPH